MRAIIIQDMDARSLLDQLTLEKFEELRHGSGRDDIPQDIWRLAVEAAHRKFHFVTCRWLQEQGASVVR